MQINTEGLETLTEDLASAIKNVSRAVEVLKDSPLKERTILLLLQDAIGTLPANKHKKVPLKVIKAVIDTIGELDEYFLKQEDEDEDE